MGNKINNQSVSRIVDNKLKTVLKDINSQLKDTNIEEREQLLITFNNLINKFYTTLSSPILSPSYFRSGVTPSYAEINEKFKQAGQDLEILFSEINSLHRFAVENFNSLNTASSSVRSRVRKIASDIADYRLYATDTIGGALNFGDTFLNTDKVDYRDELYKEEKCFVDVFAGAATLPLDESKTEVRTIEQLTIGGLSNGQSGNNQELGALRRDRLDALSDGSADSWFEYENVTFSESSQPLFFQLQVKLEENAVINCVELSTIAFGSKKHPRITGLEVSVDGSTYASVLSEVVSGRADIAETGFIPLGPTPGNMSEACKFYFQPRKVNYINILFQQDDAYTIRTPSGTAYRKAIGVRDVSIIGQGFKRKGEIVSVPIEAESEIKKVALKANLMDKSGVTNAKHFISYNNGQNWSEIQSSELLSKNAPEILNYNLEDIESIKTENPIRSIRYKCLLERSPQNFSAKASIVTQEIETTEFVNISSSTQSITLKEKPITNSVEIHNVSYGSVGGSATFYIPKTEVVSRDAYNFVYLPSKPFVKNKIAKDQEIIRVKGEVWSRVSKLEASLNGKVYEFDYVNNIIKFGNNTNGFNPDADIEFSLKRERGLLIKDESKYLELNFISDKVPETTKVYRLGEILKAPVLELRKTATIHSLGFKEIQNVEVKSDVGSILANEKTFFNGYEELKLAGDYSIDYTNGTLYTKTPVPSSGSTSIEISYREIKNVSKIEYSGNNVVILDSDYFTDRVSKSISIESPSNVIFVGDEMVEPRSIKFLTLNESFKKEVPFVGNSSEFNLGLPPSEMQGYYTVDYRNGIIYTYTPVVGTLFLDYNKSEYYVEYNLAASIPKTEYTVSNANSLVTFSDQYVITNFSNSLGRVSSRTLFKVKYKYALEVEQNPKELEPYYSPMLLDYRVSILDKDRL